MGKKDVRSRKYYEDKFIESIRARHGEYDEGKYGLAVAKAAADFHLLDVIDYQIDCLDEFVTFNTGSNGQIKQELNPLIMARDKVSRTAMDALDALQLTPRSSFKKAEGVNVQESDPMLGYLNPLLK